MMAIYSMEMDATNSATYKLVSDVLVISLNCPLVSEHNQLLQSVAMVFINLFLFQQILYQVLFGHNYPGFSEQCDNGNKDGCYGCMIQGGWQCSSTLGQLWEWSI